VIERHQKVRQSQSSTPIDNLISECLAELLAHWRGHANPTRRQDSFDQAKAYGKSEIKPNRMADDLWRKRWRW
jgi:hypothetical protein